MARTAKSPAQPCSIARAASLLADPWILVILRDAFRGVTRFDDFQALSGAAKTVVANRLRRLIKARLMSQRRYLEKPPRNEYILTDIGRDVFPLYMEFMAWGDRHLAGSAGLPIYLRHKTCAALTSPGATCTVCGERLTPEAIRYERGPGATGPQAEQLIERLATIRRRS